MQLDIITPEKVVFQEEVEEVSVPTPNGQITILPHHINLVTKIQQGELIIKVKGKSQLVALTGGFLEMNNNKLTVLADYAIKADDIDTEKVLAAQKRAEEVLKKSRENVGERDFALAESELRRSILQLQVAGKHKRRNI